MGASVTFSSTVLCGKRLKLWNTMTSIIAWANRNDFAELLRGHRLDPVLDWMRLRFPFLPLDEASIQAYILDFARKFSQSMGGRSSRSACSSVRHRQTMPLHSRMSRAI